MSDSLNQPSPHGKKLFFMMVLEFFIWGAWLPLIFGYLPSLGFSATEPPAALAGITAHLPYYLKLLFTEQALILNAFPVAAIIGMFFSNQFADRNFAAQRFLAFSHLVGGVAMLGLGFVHAFWPFFGLMLLHCLLYVPTNSICNSIAFAHMRDPQREFGLIRMGGTIGWILAAWPFTFILVDWAKVNATQTTGIVNWLGTVLDSPLTGKALQDGTRWTFIVSGAASLLLAAFSLTLPHTPPKPRGKGGAEGLAWLEALKLLKHPFILVLWIVTFIDAAVHNSFFNWAGTFFSTAKESGGAGIPGNWVMPVMSIGQVAEILTMFILGATLKKFGWKITMIVGVLGHAARFAVFAYMPESKGLIISINILHGICYAFYFATVYIFVEEYFPKDARSSAQGLFNVMVLGAGPLLANTICPVLIQSTYKTGSVVDFKNMFLLPTYIAIGAALMLAFLFWPPKSVKAPKDVGH